MKTDLLSILLKIDSLDLDTNIICEYEQVRIEVTRYGNYINNFTVGKDEINLMIPDSSNFVKVVEEDLFDYLERL